MDDDASERALEEIRRLSQVMAESNLRGQRQYAAQGGDDQPDPEAEPSAEGSGADGAS